MNQLISVLCGLLILSAAHAQDEEVTTTTLKKLPTAEQLFACKLRPPNVSEATINQIRAKLGCASVGL